MNILVFGGTRFFGKHLVKNLRERGHNVAIGTRGNQPVATDLGVEHLILNRADRDSVRAALGANRSWDFVFDQICFTASDAAITTELLEGRVGRYVHTSTLSVYEKVGEVIETDFDPFKYPYDLHPATKPFYGEGKCQAEAYYFQNAKFPVAAMRIPGVLGSDDYTGRLDIHISKVLEGRPIVIPNLFAEGCFITSTEAADFLGWLGESSSFTGPINACANGRISIGELMELVKSATGRNAKIHPEGDDKDTSPLIGEESWYASNALAQSLGYQFTNLMDWLPALIQERTQILSEEMVKEKLL